MWCPNEDCADAGENGVPGEFNKGSSTCPTCGATLVATSPERPRRSEDDLVTLPTLAITHDALLPVIKAMLDASGVRYFVKDEGVQNLIGWGELFVGHNPITGAPVLVVAPEDLEVVQEILREVEAAYRTAPDVTWDEEDAPAGEPSRLDHP